MAIKSFKRIQSTDRVVNQMQDNIEQVLRRIISSAILSGQLIEDVDIVTGTEKVVNHGLGRELRGWFIVRQNANANLWDSQATNTLSNKTLILNSSANVKISLWVF